MTKAFLPLAATIVFAVSAFGQSSPTMTVKVYFHNEKLNPNQQDCTKVFPTTRKIPKTTAVARAALDELFKGVTTEEEKNEFGSFPADDTNDIVKSLNVKGGVAYLNFKKIVFEKLGNTTSSCGGGFYSGIEATLKQFPTIKEVVYAVEGSTSDFYDWVQVGECPHGKRRCARANFQ
ncbi:MAG: GerMN domain-containing protein [Pyrinomonadaceae bacterium]